ncbi:hypothetical protein PI95_030600 [Hassallia byssoidea VB512170]|uniref:Uncharacterized protein n=1 Tax=Hassallia byssoidea VB512170 TaxID=1304833 RepID=A0A846HHD0_9CYAN|nr:hypothetical protein [Hassalia byssoidea]NEU76742.1 hypothetical protein [Hassalia byssoidea VB512170]
MFIKSYALLLIAFASAFFPRVLAAIGAPSPINFVHFVLIPLISIYIVLQTRTRIRVQMVLELLAGLLIMLALVISSAMLNQAGVINVFLDYMLRGEWFLFLLAIISINPSEKSLKQLRFGFIAFAFINLLFAYVQKFILKWGAGKLAAGDYITGVFIDQGGGCDVSSGVSIIFAIYYFTSYKNSPLWMRIAIIFAAIVHIFIADSKSHFLIFLISLLILMLSKLKLTLKGITLFAQYLLLATAFLGLIYWAAHTVATSILAYANPTLVQEGIDLKLSVFSIIPSYYHSSLNWLFGLGPGHTVGRLGGWMLRDYAELLNPLGATKSPASKAVWDAVWATFIGPRTRLWSPLFGWAGIWGDWGFLGVAAFLYVLFITWRRFCVDDSCRVILLSVAIFGCIFTQMEEPGYVIPVAAIIGLRWQEEQMSKRSPHHPMYIPTANRRLEIT